MVERELWVPVSVIQDLATGAAQWVGMMREAEFGDEAALLRDDVRVALASVCDLLGLDARELDRLIEAAPVRRVGVAG